MKKIAGWNKLLKVKQLEYKKDIITTKASNEKDPMVVLVFWNDFHNVQNLIFLTLIIKSKIHDYL